MFGIFLTTRIDLFLVDRAEPFNSKEFSEWVVQGTTPGYDASLKLYRGLMKLGFTIILLTGRDEDQRSVTERNLIDAGYSGWDQLLLRQAVPKYYWSYFLFRTPGLVYYRKFWILNHYRYETDIDGLINLGLFDLNFNLVVNMSYVDVHLLSTSKRKRKNSG